MSKEALTVQEVKNLLEEDVLIRNRVRAFFRWEMRRLGITKDELRHQLGMKGSGTMSKIMDGSGGIGAGWLLRIANRLGRTVSQIVGDVKEPDMPPAMYLLEGSEVDPSKPPQRRGRRKKK